MKNQRIALYLSGQYPGHYRTPNRFDILAYIKQLDQVNFSDTMIGLLQGKSDGEFYYTLLESFEKIHGIEGYKKLLDKLVVPEEVQVEPGTNTLSQVKFDYTLVSQRLDTINEEDFGRFIIAPLLVAMGYKNVEFKGKVNETDNGLDFFPLKYTSPYGIVHYSGVQIKSCKLTSKSTGGEMRKLIAETNTALGMLHTNQQGQKVNLHEFLIFNARDIQESARRVFFDDIEIEKRKEEIILLGKDGILSLLDEYKVEINILD